MKTGIRMAVAMLAAVSSGAMAAPFSVSSNDMRDGQPLAQQHWFAGFGCTGGNVSPQLAWKKRPGGYAQLRGHRPGIPMRLPGSGWWHWTVVNIASSVFSLPAGAGDKNSATLPGGAIQGRNDFGYAGFGGACRRREINRTAIALRYGRWMSPRCRWMPGPAGRWSAICYTAMLSPAHS